MFSKIGLAVMGLLQPTAIPPQIDFIVHKEEWEVVLPDVYHLFVDSNVYTISFDTYSLTGSISVKKLSGHTEPFTSLDQITLPAEYIAPETPGLIVEGGPGYWHLSVNKQKLFVESGAKQVPMRVQAFLDWMTDKNNDTEASVQYQIDHSFADDTGVLFVPIYQDVQLDESGSLKVITCDSINVRCDKIVLETVEKPTKLANLLGELKPNDYGVHSRLILKQGSVYYLPVPFKANK